MVNIVALVFAHNEALLLPFALDEIKNSGKINHIVVIDDGSTDSTAKVARNYGATVVSHKTNLGKRQSFITGALKAKELGAQVLLTLDADITSFPKSTFDSLVNEVTVKKKLMAVATQHEAYPLDDWRAGRVLDTHSNAQRAINMQALDPLFNGDSKWIDALTTNKRKWEKGKFSEKEKAGGYKWALEYTLDMLIPKSKISYSMGHIVTRQPYRRGADTIRSQKYAREIVKDQLNNRLGKAKSIMQSARKNPAVWKALRKKWLAMKKETVAKNKIRLRR